MRQWELFGITDQEPVVVTPVPRRAEEQPATIEPIGPTADEPEFFWATDTALRMHVVSEAAVEVMGWPAGRCLGEDLLTLFGLGGPNFDVVSAHVNALGGETDTFTLEGPRGTVRCWVGPVHDETGRLSGTRCLAVAMESVDVRDASTGTAVA
jgi:hypothetical protein